MVLTRLGDAGVNKVNAQGEVPLSVACIHNKPTNVECLLKHNAETKPDGAEIFPIHFALKHNSIAYVAFHSNLFRSYICYYCCCCC